MRTACGAVRGSRLIAVMIRSPVRGRCTACAVFVGTGFILREEGAPPGGRGALLSRAGGYTGSGCRSRGAGSGARESLPGHHIRRRSSTLAVVTR
ncbi:hypothetical protein GCM10010297_53800 [Streptomyces malachitofuscus]|nr:hypothetical protein GCM10010297_53800 [Streptomyces malachitofuscus]